MFKVSGVPKTLNRYGSACCGFGVLGLVMGNHMAKEHGNSLYVEADTGIYHS